MDRRRVLLIWLAGALAAPLAGEAQPANKVYRGGVLTSSSATAYRDNLEALRAYANSAGSKGRTSSSTIGSRKAGLTGSQTTPLI